MNTLVSKPFSVNFHLWEPCNFRCQFCFATFQDVRSSILPKGHLPQEDHLRIIEALAKAGTQKLTFAGGEPTLCPWLPELIEFAKSMGIITMLVTNGSKLTDSYLERLAAHLDWCAISVDSLKPEINLRTGRTLPTIGKKPFGSDEYLFLIDKVKSFNIKFKLNTVVHAFNYEEDFNDFVWSSQPKRWKVFQVLPIEGQNDIHIADYLITPMMFESFLEKHHNCEQLVAESNDAMKNSYWMIDPAGRFYNNTTGTLVYTQPILEIGIEKALLQNRLDAEHFLERGGLYLW